jgi:hypothetical protein
MIKAGGLAGMISTGVLFAKMRLEVHDNRLQNRFGCRLRRRFRDRMFAMKPGLSLATAASVILRDAIVKHMEQFALVIRRDRTCNASVVAAYVDGLAGATALTVAGGHGPREQVIEAVIQSLRTAVDRDLRMIAEN